MSPGRTGPGSAEAGRGPRAAGSGAAGSPGPLAVALALALLGPAWAAQPSDEERAREAELGAVRERIEALRARMADTSNARDDLQAELQHLELRSAELAGELRQLEQGVGTARARLAELTAERQTRDAELRRQREALAREMRAAYLVGRRGYLPLLLNQEDPGRVARAIAYHRYLQRAHAERIGAIQTRIDELAVLERRVAQQQEALATLQQEKARAQSLLEEQRRARGEVLARLRNELRASGAEVERLTENAQALEGVLRQLREGLPEIGEGDQPGRPFAQMKGALPWPVHGRVRAGFGAPRPGGLTWQGVVIGAAAGSPVQAVHRGRVAFADWLRGLGLLVILDHGDGFMTLYGHNQRLLRQVGDWVDAGEPLAIVGDSGGAAEPGLYFELRLRGAPINPAQWCRGSPARG